MFSSQRNTDIVMDTVILGIVVVFMNGSVKWSLYWQCVGLWDAKLYNIEHHYILLEKGP